MPQSESGRGLPYALELKMNANRTSSNRVSLWRRIVKDFRAVRGIFRIREHNRDPLAEVPSVRPPGPGDALGSSQPVMLAKTAGNRSGKRSTWSMME